MSSFISLPRPKIFLCVSDRRTDPKILPSTLTFFMPQKIIDRQNPEIPLRFICITRVIYPCFGIVHRNLGYCFSIIKISIIIKTINLKLNTLVESVEPVLLTREDNSIHHFIWVNWEGGSGRGLYVGNGGLPFCNVFPLLIVNRYVGFHSKRNILKCETKRKYTKI
jgi:hypothetical protein